MGCRPSKAEKEARKISNAIDLQLQEEARKFAFFDVRILAYREREDDSETFQNFELKRSMRMHVMRTILEMTQRLESLGIEYENPESKVYTERLCAYVLHGETLNSAEQTLEALKELLNDSRVQECIKAVKEVRPSTDSSFEFLSDLDRMFHPDYNLTEEDESRFPLSYIPIKFIHQSFQFRIMESEIMKRSRILGRYFVYDVTDILFQVDLTTYDQVLPEDEEINRMRERLQLFQSICTYPWFSEARIILHFMGKDVFDLKIQNSPLSICFPDYEGENTGAAASEYIKKQFENVSILYPDMKISSYFTSMHNTDVLEFLQVVAFDRLVFFSERV